MWVLLCLAGSLTSVLACEAIASSSGPLAKVETKLSRQEPMNVLFVGSSTTAGVGASNIERAFPAVFARRVQERLPQARVSLTVLGRGGDVSSNILLRLAQALDVMPKPDLIIWQGGTNDALRAVPEAEMSAALAEGIALAARAGADLLFVDPQFFPRITDVERYERFVGLFDEAAISRNIPVVLRYRAMKAVRGDETRLNLLLAADRFHLSDEGHRCLGEAVADAVLARVAAKQR